MVQIDARILERIDGKLIQLNKLRPLKGPQLKKLQNQLVVEMTYNSNAIEGNTLSLRETQLILEEGITVKGKSLKEHLEAKDQYEAIDFLYSIINDKKVRLSEKLICELHRLVTRETDQENAGMYRTGNVRILGATHIPPSSFKVPREMKKLISWITTNQKKLHPIELASKAHHEFVSIHPFFDGNGRTARLLMNLLLMRKGYPMAIILKADRKKYYRVLDQGNRDNFDPFLLFISLAVERSLDMYLQTFDKKEDGDYLSLSNLANVTPYSPKYLNLLARTGKIGAIKQGRNWLATLKSVEAYRRQRLRDK